MAEKQKKRGVSFSSAMMSTPALALTAGLLGGGLKVREFLKLKNRLQAAGKFVGKEEKLRKLVRAEVPKEFIAGALTHGGSTALGAEAFKRLHLKSLAERKQAKKKLRNYELAAIKNINA